MFQICFENRRFFSHTLCWAIMTLNLICVNDIIPLLPEPACPVGREGWPEGPG